ncbi:hypothetical protein MP638_002542 [Amoeboaphelidium occidentale]|nr:hypothetical protein MP638_002542 [Amoeboaphelidium occidentale]
MSSINPSIRKDLNTNISPSTTIKKSTLLQLIIEKRKRFQANKELQQTKVGRSQSASLLPNGRSKKTLSAFNTPFEQSAGAIGSKSLKNSNDHIHNKSYDKLSDMLKKKLGQITSNDISALKIKKWSSTSKPAGNPMFSAPSAQSSSTSSSTSTSKTNTLKHIREAPKLVKKLASESSLSCVPSHLTPIALQPNSRLFRELFSTTTCQDEYSDKSSIASSTVSSRRESIFIDIDAPPVPKMVYNQHEKRLERKAVSVSSLEPVHGSSTFPGHRYYQPRTDSHSRLTEIFPESNHSQKSSLSRKSSKSAHVVKETPLIVEGQPSSEYYQKIKERIKNDLKADNIQGIINRYVIIKEIGEGSFSKVYLAYNLDDGKYFACKAISKKRLKKKSMWKNGPERKRKATVGNQAGVTVIQVPVEDENNTSSTAVKKTDYMDMVRHEIAILKRLSKHPHISTLVEVLEDSKSDMLYMIMELCEYGSLMKLSRECAPPPLSEELARRYFRGMVLGLEYLHYMKILHRDIKPENILLNASNNAVIGDFSISYCADALVDGNEPSPHGGNGIFTPMFTPPELINSEAYPNAKKGFFAPIDIWGLGVTLFCLVHGKVPFDGEDLEQVYHKIVNMSVVSVLSKKLTADLRSLIQGLLEKNPDDRITLDEVRRHTWVTNNGQEQLPSKKMNCINLLGREDSTISSILSQEEINTAVTPATFAVFEKLRKLTLSAKQQPIK